MAQTELKFNDPEEVQGPEDVMLPKHAHPMQVRSELSKLLMQGVLEADEMDTMYEAWLDGRGEGGLESAVDTLEAEGVVDADEAEDLRSRL